MAGAPLAPRLHAQEPWQHGGHGPVPAFFLCRTIAALSGLKDEKEVLVEGCPHATREVIHQPLLRRHDSKMNNNTDSKQCPAGA